MKLPVLNAEDARYECTFGRGCDGVCCRNGRPPLYPDEVARIEENLSRILPLLNADAAALIRAQGFLTKRIKAGQQAARVLNGWCVFFNAGCALHRLGAEEGDSYRYKPVACALFPLSRDEHDRWYIRQKGYMGEIWELPCLDPRASARLAVDTLAVEIALAERITNEELRIAVEDG